MASALLGLPRVGHRLRLSANFFVQSPVQNRSKVSLQLKLLQHTWVVSRRGVVAAAGLDQGDWFNDTSYKIGYKWKARFFCRLSISVEPQLSMWVSLSLPLCLSFPLCVCAVNLWLEAKTTTIHLMSFYGRTHTRHYLIRFQPFERSTCCAGPQQLQLKYLSLPLSLSLSRAYHLTFAAVQFSVNFSLTASLSLCVCLSQTVSSCFSPVSICKNNFCLAFIPHSRIKVNS